MQQVEKAAKMSIRKGDTVQVITGKEKGKTGKVLEVKPERRQVFVEKLNIVKRHLKAGGNQRQGGIVAKEGPLHVSKVMLVCHACGKATRIGIKQLADGKKLRMCKRCHEALDRG